MLSITVFITALALGAQGAMLRDVPLGECHGCEVTCFEDCMLKYDREIMQTDMFLQIESKKANRTEEMSSEYSQCLKDDKCPCEKEEVAAAGGKSLLQMNKKFCALDEVPCARKCSQKVVSKAEASLKEKAPKTVQKQSLLQRDYPIHSVAVGVFSRGAMNMDQCLKFCLAATCGCSNAPGLKTIDRLFDAIKANDAANPGEKDFSHRGAVVDTHQAAQFRPAEIKECAKGMIGKKVSEDLWIDMGEGVGGEVEICTKKFMEKIFGPGDHKKKMDLCKSKKSDDAKWGCIWNDKKGFCGVGFSPNLRCQVKFYDDPSKL